MRGRDKPCALGYLDGSCQLIAELPVEIVVRNVEYDFFSAVGIFQPIGHVLSADMHVWTEPDELRVLFEYRLCSRAFPIWIVWWDGKRIGILRSRDGVADVTIFRFFFRQHETNLGMIDHLAPIGRVVNLDIEIHVCWNQLSGFIKTVIGKCMPGT